MNKQILIALIGVLYLSGCASIAIPGDEVCRTDFLECVEEPQKVELPTYRKLRYLPPAETMPVVAIYNFGDGTGQRKSQDGVASFSTAVTQDAKSLLEIWKAEFTVKFLKDWLIVCFVIQQR